MAKTEEEFYAEFGEPVVFNDNDEYLYETYGEQLETVLATDKHLVWTVVESSDSENLLLVPGVQYVNRLNYIIMEKPWTEEQAKGEWAEVLWLDQRDFAVDDSFEGPAGP